VTVVAPYALATVDHPKHFAIADGFRENDGGPAVRTDNERVMLPKHDGLESGDGELGDQGGPRG
jgi:hypothetical protein